MGAHKPHNKPLSIVTEELVARNEQAKINNQALKDALVTYLKDNPEKKEQVETAQKQAIRGLEAHWAKFPATKRKAPSIAEKVFDEAAAESNALNKENTGLKHALMAAGINPDSIVPPKQIQQQVQETAQPKQQESAVSTMMQKVKIGIGKLLSAFKGEESINVGAGEKPVAHEPKLVMNMASEDKIRSMSTRPLTPSSTPSVQQSGKGVSR